MNRHKIIGTVALGLLAFAGLRAAASSDSGGMEWQTGDTVQDGITPFARNGFAGLIPVIPETDRYQENYHKGYAALADGKIDEAALGFKDNGVLPVTFEEPCAVYALRFITCHATARKSIRIKSIVVTDAVGRQTTISNGVSVGADNPSTDTTSSSYYAWLRRTDGRALAVNVKKVEVTFGKANYESVYSEIEALTEGTVPDIEAFETELGTISGKSAMTRVRVKVSAVATDARVYYAQSASALANPEACPFVRPELIDDAGLFEVEIPAFPKSPAYMRIAALGAGSSVLSDVIDVPIAGIGIARGGDEIYAALDGSSDVVHVFTDVTGVRTFRLPAAKAGSFELEYLIVGGGGSGGAGKSGEPNAVGGGGGGGGVLAGSVVVAAGATLKVCVGAGGAAPTAELQDGNNGEDSYLELGDARLTALGGGGGGSYQQPGKNGGNGGGGGGDYATGYDGGLGLQTNAEGTACIGHLGANLCADSRGVRQPIIIDGQLNPALLVGYRIGGGAGAGGDGHASKDRNPGGGESGGIGMISAITGESAYYAGGGASGSKGNGSRADGGLGGGGKGANKTLLPADWDCDGADGLGGGGGGGDNAVDTNNFHPGRYAGRGGNGVVILRYHPQSAVPSGSCMLIR